MNTNDFDNQVKVSVAHGFEAAIDKFILKNNVSLTPLGKEKNPKKAFISRLLAEYNRKPKPAPFAESFKSMMDFAVQQEMEVLRLVFANKEYENLAKICRIIGCNTTLEYLERYREPALKLIRKIRGLK